MKYLFDELEGIIFSKKTIGLFLDFDGTLASIKDYPQRVILPIETRRILLNLKNRPDFFLAIISGRKLEDLKNKINIPDIIYSGNHGLEWEIEGKKQSIFIKKIKLKMLLNLKKRIEKLQIDFKGMYIENKKITISVHYRLVNENRIELFKKEFEKIIKPYIQSGKIKLMQGKKVFSIRPKAGWTKGNISKMLVEQISQKEKVKLFPIYIGDDTTDEDAFLQLKEGITIKVGKSSESCARYYVDTTKEVVEILQWLTNRTLVKTSIPLTSIPD